jgi:hypothetical protein
MSQNTPLHILLHRLMHRWKRQWRNKQGALDRLRDFSMVVLTSEGHVTQNPVISNESTPGRRYLSVIPIALNFQGIFLLITSQGAPGDWLPLIPTL